MKNIYCGRSEFIKAIKRNSKKNIVHIFIEPKYSDVWFATQKAVWNYKFVDAKDILQMQFITKRLKVMFQEYKP